MQTHTHFRSLVTLGLALAVAACVALAVLLLRASAPLDIDVAMAATTVLNSTSSNDLQIFLRVDGVTGAADELNHQNDIVVDSYSFGTSRTPNAASPTMSDFVVTMPANKTSSKLMVYAAGSVNISKAVLVVRRKGATQDLVRWTLTDAFLSSFQTVGNTHGDGVQDQVGITFGKVEAEYRQFMPDGTYGDAVKTGWDRRSNKPVPVK